MLAVDTPDWKKTHFKQEKSLEVWTGSDSPRTADSSAQVDPHNN